MSLDLPSKPGKGFSCEFSQYGWNHDGEYEVDHKGNRLQRYRARCKDEIDCVREDKDAEHVGEDGEEDGQCHVTARQSDVRDT